MSVENILNQIADALGLSVEELKGRLTQKSHNLFSPVPYEERMKMWDAVAKERSRIVGKPCPVFGHLGEADAARFLNRNQSTLRRAREDGTLIPGKHFVPLGERGIRYGVWQLCEMWLFGVGPWDDTLSEPTNSGPITSPNATGAPVGIEPGTTVEPSDALRSARRILKKPSRD